MDQVIGDDELPNNGAVYRFEGYLYGQLSAAGPRGLSVEGNVSVLGDEQRVKGTLFDRSGQHSWRDSFVRFQ
jgi:hypothetical protein